MVMQKEIIKIESPSLQQGFLGEGHTARAVIHGDFSETDPFIILMDDVLDKKTNEPAGGPHPHAGFETVSLVLDGEIGEDDHVMKAGDFQIMTAGSGVIHTESIHKKTKMRLLQLWLNIPKKLRWVNPRVQDLRNDSVPAVNQKGVEIKVYSGSFATVKSPVKNYVPLIVAEIKMDANSKTSHRIPATHNSFIYVLDGEITVGEKNAILRSNQIGWLDRSGEDIPTEVKLSTINGARLVLYSGLPQGENIVSHGPFIGDTNEDIVRLYQEYRQGKMKHISSVGESQKFRW